jgi:hypothetical protein
LTKTCEIYSLWFFEELLEHIGISRGVHLHHRLWRLPYTEVLVCHKQRVEVIPSNLSIERSWVPFRCWVSLFLTGFTSRVDGEMETKSEGDDDQMPILEDDCDNVEYPVEGESLVARYALSAQVKEDDMEQQRENIFHTRCHINNMVCSIIIDGGSCTNVASTILVEKLNLPTLKHPKPYKLQWLNDSGEVKVNKQVLVSFSIGRYKDEVFCDVVPMHASHILLGRPWQFDRKAIHDGFKNRHSFVKDNRTITLVPLTHFYFIFLNLVHDFNLVHNTK